MMTKEDDKFLKDLVNVGFVTTSILMVMLK